jgi:uncharacterized membrane protein (DUF373 family)
MLFHLATILRTIRMVSIGPVSIDSSRSFVSGVFNLFVVVLLFDIVTKYVRQLKLWPIRGRRRF